MSAENELSLRPKTVGFCRRQEKNARALSFLDGNPVIAGIDLGKTRHAVWFSDKAGRPLQRTTIPHSREGCLELLERARALCAENGFDRLLVFMESTSYFWENVANVLEEHKVGYHLVASLAVSRSREVEHLTYAKGDYRDAELIAKLGLQGVWLKRMLGEAEPWLALRTLTYEHETILQALVSERTRVRSFLGHVFPEFLDTFKDPLGKQSRQVLRALATEPVPHLYPALLDRLENLPRHRLSKLKPLLAQLKLAPSFGVDRRLAPTLFRLQQAVERFDVLEHQRDELGSRLGPLYQATPYQKYLDTIPGVSPQSHALLLGFLGDPKNFDRASCLVKYAGIEPRENHSGHLVGSHSISGRGNRSLRHLLYRIVMGLRSGNAEFAAYLERLRSREPKPLPWRQACVAAANKYLRLVYALCIRGKAFNPSKLSSQS